MSTTPPRTSPALSSRTLAARARLEQAALDLFAAHGFEAVTAAQIAQAAGVTERTFFRHFADKREVLFGGEQVLDHLFAQGLAERFGTDPAPVGASGLAEAGAVVLERIIPVFSGREAAARLREEIISSSPALREREIAKSEALRQHLALSLTGHGVPERTAHLSAALVIGALNRAVTEWFAAAAGPENSLEAIASEVFAQIPRLTA